MKVDGGLGLTPDMEAIAANARAQEAAGYDGIWSAETSHDPFLPLVVAAANTERLELGTAIAVAFARNPMLLGQHRVGSAGDERTAGSTWAWGARSSRTSPSGSRWSGPSPPPG